MPEPGNPSHARGLLVAVLTLSLLAASYAMASSPRPPRPRPRPLTRQRPLTALLKAAAYPNAEPLIVVLTMQQLAAAHREWDGYEYFGRLADAQPQRRVLLRAMQAVMQVRVAGDVPLLQRAAWVKDAIRKLDDGAAADPVIGRFTRGLVLAELPARFDRARLACHGFG